MKENRTVTVVAGGVSGERDISLKTGSQVCESLGNKGIDVELYDPMGDPQFHELVKKKPRLVFNALHGGDGEDGTFQDVLEKNGIEFTGSRSGACRLAINKYRSKQVLKKAGIWVPEAQLVSSVEDITLEYPFVLKPVMGGSSIGVHLVKEPSSLESAFDLTQTYSKQILAEQYIRGKELTVGVLLREPMEVGEILVDGIFHYAEKYRNYNNHRFPATLDSDIIQFVQSQALRAHDCLGLGSYSRSDFICDEDGQLWCLEVNALPGLTENSLFPRSAESKGIGFEDLCEIICANVA